MKKFGIPTISIVVIIAAFAAGCGEDNDNKNGGAPERQSAHQQKNVDRTPPEVLAMPDHWNNIADRCDGHGHRVYATSNKSGAPSNLFVISDETCG